MLFLLGKKKWISSDREREQVYRLRKFLMAEFNIFTFSQFDWLLNSMAKDFIILNEIGLNEFSFPYKRILNLNETGDSLQAAISRYGTGYRSVEHWAVAIFFLLFFGAYLT